MMGVWKNTRYDAQGLPRTDRHRNLPYRLPACARREQAGHGDNDYTAINEEAEPLQPPATEPSLRKVFVAILVKLCFRLDFQAAYIGAPEGGPFSWCLHGICCLRLDCLAKAVYKPVAVPPVFDGVGEGGRPLFAGRDFLFVVCAPTGQRGDQFFQCFAVCRRHVFHHDGYLFCMHPPLYQSVQLQVFQLARKYPGGNAFHGALQLVEPCLSAQ